MGIIEKWFGHNEPASNTIGSEEEVKAAAAEFDMGKPTQENTHIADGAAEGVDADMNTLGSPEEVQAVAKEYEIGEPTQQKQVAEAGVLQGAPVADEDMIEYTPTSVGDAAQAVAERADNVVPFAPESMATSERKEADDDEVDRQVAAR
jgi:hypothetical protein